MPAGRPLAVFCDFDGTFSVQDVGSTLAQARLPERRVQLWDRFAQGEFTAWTYVLALFKNFELPEKELYQFLETIDLDPGARDLLAWCRAESVPFRILSDGFDWNLERMQAINEVSFEYNANHLEYEGDIWRLAAGAPNDACGCGTGSCKKTLIGAYREKNPGTFCVHIGNGKVSDIRGDNTFAEAGGGKVLQVQHMTSASSTSTTSSSFVATALTDTITPSATSSKILILATGNINNTSVNNWTYATLRRGGTNLGNSPGMVGVYFAGGDSHAPSTMNYLDSPNSTSELTYDVAIRVSGSTGKWNQQSATINLTLIEIGA